MSELNIENIIIREASLNDAEIIFKLSNDDSVRENSINRNKIEWSNHINWLKEKIASDNYFIYMFFDKDSFIGQVKFEIDGETAVISISIVKEYRKKKLAVPMIRKGIDRVFCTKKSFNRIIAYIKPENKASEKSFKKIGFDFLDLIEINNEEFNRYILLIEKMNKYKILNSTRVFIIAELSANHNQDYERALKTIAAAKEAGADAIKMQTYTADTISLNSEKEIFKVQQGTIWDGTTLYKLYQQAYTPWEWQPKLKKYAEELGMICFSSPFDKTAVDFLEEMDVPAYKIASFEIFDIPLIEYAASKKKPMIISTGIASLSDIEEAVNACRRAGNNEIALLKCTSAYPAPVEEANLFTIPHLRDTFNVIPGLSDHTMGISIAVAAVALGAKIIEKHFILDRNIGGPDSAFSMEPAELKQMVDAIRDVEKALGKVSYEITPKVEKSRVFARSLFIVMDVKAGDIITEENVRSIRPGYGLHPKHYHKVLGKKFRKDFEMGTPISWEQFE